MVTSVGSDASTPLLSGPPALAAAASLRAAGTRAAEPWVELARAVWWAGLFAVAVVGAHALTRALARRRHLPPPAWTAWPRPELAVALIITPALAAAGARVLPRGAAGAAVGAAVLTLCPAAALAAAAALLAASITGTGDDRTSRPARAAYVLTPAAAAAAAAGAALDAPPRRERVVRALLGAPPPQGEWEDPTAPKGAFTARAGPLFDAAGGPPLVRRGATFDVDPSSGRPNRGWLAPAPGAALGDGASAAVLARRASAGARAGAVLLATARTAALGVAVGAPGAGAAQAGAALGLAAAYTLYVRCLTPWRLRHDAAAELAGGAADVVTSLAALALAAYGPLPPSSSVAGSGAAILLSQLGALVAFVASRILLSSHAVRTAPWRRGPPFARGRAAPAQRVANAAAAVLRVVRSDPAWLVRKYGARWAAATPGVGARVAARLRTGVAAAAPVAPRGSGLPPLPPSRAPSSRTSGLPASRSVSPVRGGGGGLPSPGGVPRPLHKSPPLLLPTTTSMRSPDPLLPRGRSSGGGVAAEATSSATTPSKAPRGSRSAAADRAAARVRKAGDRLKAAVTGLAAGRRRKAKEEDDV